MSQSTGVYSLERETFAMLDARVPSELPLDLVVSRAIATWWIVFFLWVFLYSIYSIPGPADPFYVLSLLGFILVAAFRLAGLAKIRRARNGLPRLGLTFRR